MRAVKRRKCGFIKKDMSRDVNSINGRFKTYVAFGMRRMA